jgi:hypothetical protein
MIEEIEQKLTEYLYSGAKEFYYKGHRFEIEEYIYSNPVEFNSYTRISIKAPVYLSFQDIYSTMYENRPGMEKMEHFLRIEACARLAKEFVTVALPKIDYELEKELHNQKIEEILEVLE